MKERVKQFLRLLYRIAVGDYRCIKCNCKLIPWRDGVWVCRCCDLIPPHPCLHSIVTTSPSRLPKKFQQKVKERTRNVKTSSE